MYERILVQLDSSPLAEQSPASAKLLATRFESAVVLLQAILPIGDWCPRARADAAKKRWSAMSQRSTT
jgi:nucleotide-binding universal stress UspA family protein